ncbi:flagellin [Polynucleobacter sp. SHI8]|nr:flagellin [Polynucleobacter sp. SHI2]BDW14191.1 flagellin [Polynucleobacter sp. SHI8]
MINTNISSIIAQSNLTKTSDALQVNIERLSSGLRVNNAADDASGFAIANRMDAQIRGMAVATRNANDAISFSQTASGALSQISNNLQRMRELAVQAANGSNSASDTSLLNQEFSQLQTEVSRIQGSTTFNNVSVFTASDTVFQIGANTTANDRVNIQGTALNSTKALVSKTITDGTTTNTASDINDAINAANSIAAGSESNKINFMYNTITDAINSSQKLSLSSKDAALYKLENLKNAYFSASVRQSTVSLALFVNDARNIFVVQRNPGTWTSLAVKSYLTTGNVPEAPNVRIWATDGSSEILNGVEAGIGIGCLNQAAASSITTGQSNALSTIAAIDLALTEVNTANAQHGAVQNRLSAVISNLTAFSQSQIAAKSRIVDADFATEIAKLSSNSILQQSGSAMLTKANQSSSNVLALLKGL